MDTATNMTNMSNPVEDFALQTFLCKLTKKCAVRCNQHKEMQLQEEDALKLCHLLIKEGYFDINDINGCAVCAVENLEKKILQQMKQQMEVVKKARSYYSQPENARHYKLCTKHLPVNLNYVPFPQPQMPQPKPPLQFVPPQAPPQAHPHFAEPPRYVQYPMPSPPPPFTYFPESLAYSVPVIHAIGPQFSFDSFIPIPPGVDPVSYMTNYNEWVRHLQQFHGTNNHRRMQYTKSFPLEMSDESKIVGRRFM